MKRHFLYFSLLILASAAIVLYNQPYSYFLNEPLLMNSISAEDLKDYSPGAEITPLTYDTTIRNIFHIKLKNNNLKNFLNHFSLFSKDYISIDALEEYIVIADDNGKISRMVHWKPEYGTVKNAVADSGGNVYVHSLKYDAYNARVTEEYIYRMASGEKAFSPAVRYDYKDKGPFGTGAIRGLQADAEGIAFFVYTIEDSSLSLVSYRNGPEKIMEIQVPPGQTIMDLSGTTPGSIIYTTIQSQLGYIDSKGQLNAVREYLPENTTLQRLLVLEGQPYVQIASGQLDQVVLTKEAVGTKRVALSRASAEEYIAARAEAPLGFERLEYAGHLAFSKFAVLSLYLIAFLMFAYALWFAYVYLLQKRLLLVTKILRILVPLIVAAILATIYFVMTWQVVNFSEDIRKGKMMAFDRVVNMQLDRIARSYGDDYLTGFLEGLDPNVPIAPEEYHTFETNVSLNNINSVADPITGGQPVDVNGMYLVIDRIIDGKSYKVLDSENNFRVFEKRSADNGFINRAINGETVYDSNANYIFTLRPILNSEKQQVGILQVGMDYGGYKKHNDMIFMGIVLKSITVIPAVFLPLMILMIYTLMRPVGILTREVLEINDENLSKNIQIKTRDEIEDLADAFNQMTSNISAHIGDIKRMGESYHRFVPQEIFRLLSKERVEEVSLGDSSRVNTTILCAGINNFYEITEHMGQDESFDLINRHLKVMGPIIRKHGGIVEKYLDMGIVAMFPEGADAAVTAAIEIHRKIDRLRRNSNTDFKDVSVAIHKGEVLVGIIGEEKRLQSNIVSDTASLCMILQGKATALSSRILVSGEAFKELKDVYKYRKLGCIKPVGRQSTTEVMDVYQGDGERELKLKEQSAQQFSRAVEAFVSGSYEKARADFVRVLEKNIEDSIARLYFFETDRRLSAENSVGVKELEI